MWEGRKSSGIELYGLVFLVVVRRDCQVKAEVRANAGVGPYAWGVGGGEGRLAAHCVCLLTRCVILFVV
jgi:hypothetical protein